MSPMIDPQAHVCTMLWMSISGWDNRPDYFCQNDFYCLGDLAYIASEYTKRMADALSHWRPGDVHELAIGFQRNIPESEPLWRLLNDCNEDHPLMCNLDEYRKWRESEVAE